MNWQKLGKRTASANLIAQVQANQNLPTSIPGSPIIATPIPANTTTAVTTSVTTAASPVNADLGIVKTTTVTAPAGAEAVVVTAVVPETEEQKNKKLAKYAMYGAAGLLAVAIIYKLAKK